MNIYGESTMGRSGVIFHFPVTYLMMQTPAQGTFHPTAGSWALVPQPQVILSLHKGL